MQQNFIMLQEFCFCIHVSINPSQLDISKTQVFIGLY